MLWRGSGRKHNRLTLQVHTAYCMVGGKIESFLLSISWSLVFPLWNLMEMKHFIFASQQLSMCVLCISPSLPLCFTKQMDGLRNKAVLWFVPVRAINTLPKLTIMAIKLDLLPLVNTSISSVCISCSFPGSVKVDVLGKVGFIRNTKVGLISEEKMLEGFISCSWFQEGPPIMADRVWRTKAASFLEDSSRERSPKLAGFLPCHPALSSGTG